MLHFIIDAFNVTRSGAAAGLARSGDEHSSLLAYINENSLTGSVRNKVTVVFDGHKPGDFRNPYPGMAVRFSNSRQADPVIKELVRAHGNPGILIVVSSDREIQDFVRSCGGKVIGSAEFLSAKPGRTRRREPETARKQSRKQERQITKELSELWLDEE